VSQAKAAVQAFWDDASCGEALYLPGVSREDYEAQLRVRYELEPYIPEFAEFSRWRGKRVLEIGVGLGADHQMLAKGGASLSGVDLTPRAIEHTRRRFQTLQLESDLRVADAEALPFGDGSFDLVYSWGVLHHSPNTQQAINEVYRILKPGGEARIMIYHRYSFVGYMLWLRYGLFAMRPFCGLDFIYSKYLESPGTKAYSVKAAKKLFSHFPQVQIRTVLTHGDLLTSSAGQRHEGPLLAVARRIWPRRIIRRVFPSHGLFMLISATKAQAPSA
jgi:SAM-dependent methyltransferase